MRLRVTKRARVEHLGQYHSKGSERACLMQRRQEKLRFTDKTKKDENCYVGPSDQRDGRKRVRMQRY